MLIAWKGDMHIKTRIEGVEVDLHRYVHMIFGKDDHR